SVSSTPKRRCQSRSVSRSTVIGRPSLNHARLYPVAASFGSRATTRRAVLRVAGLRHRLFDSNIHDVPLNLLSLKAPVCFGRSRSTSCSRGQTARVSQSSGAACSGGYGGTGGFVKRA